MATEQDIEGIRSIVAARARLAALRAGIEAGDPWPLAERFDHTPEASWGPPEILAHCVEMVGYWRAELARVAAGHEASPVAFGRIASDGDRVTAIERDRRLSSAALFDRLDDALAGVLATAATWSPEQRARLGIHPTGDVLDVEAGLQRFVGGHLLAHVDQLEATSTAAVVEPPPAAGA